MKIDRHGKAKILSQAEIQLLFNQGLQNSRDRALFGICLYCCCRINEACTLSVTDVYDRAGKARAEQRYLEVKPEQVRGAMSALSMLGHEGGDFVGKGDLLKTRTYRKSRVR